MSRARQFADLAGSADAGGLTGRNLIINGAMQVWQRGTDFNSISNGEYTTDRFFINRIHTVNVDRVDCSLDGFKYAIKITNVASGNPTMYQKIENDGRIYAGQIYTLSFWAKASEAITMRSGRVYNYDDSAYVVDYDLVDLTTSWKKYYVTKTVGSGWDEDDVSYGLQILAGHTGNTFSAGATLEITGVQYELGDKATPFEHRSFGEELALCQRYFCKSYNYSVAPGTVSSDGQWTGNIVRNGSNQNYWHIKYPVEMRAKATTKHYSPTDGAGTTQFRNYSDSENRSSASDSTGSSGSSVRPNAGTNQGLGDVIGFHWTADAEL